MVSVDVVPLVTLHFLLAGAIVARAEPSWWTRRLGAAQRPRTRSSAAGWPTPSVPVVAVASIAGLVLAWFAIQPLRADVHSSQADQATARNVPQAALADLEQATSEASWQGVYWLQRSKADGAVGNIDQGLADLRHALSANPRDVNAAASLARVEVALKDYPAAIKYFRIALHLDPRNPDYQTELKDAEAKATGEPVSQ
jgi:tetratricopeptide (TPR) repeat protein